MHYSVIAAPTAEPISLAEAVAYLKLEHGEEDAFVAALIRSAREACELFTGLALITRDMRAKAVHQGTRFYLQGAPIQKLLAVSASLGADTHELDVAELTVETAAGRSYIEISSPQTGSTVSVDYRVGLGSDWNAVPETLRQGMLRLIAHQYDNRSETGLSALPGAVTALWQPFRQVRL
ncbi:MAG: hypothetical protein ACFBZ9_06120 [Sphingomonadales bacterium]|mgnify:CR=1 FL=1